MDTVVQHITCMFAIHAVVYKLTGLPLYESAARVLIMYSTKYCIVTNNRATESEFPYTRIMT